jgi:DNA polymerase-3 subunit epsilon
LNPERAVEPGAFKVHGRSNDFLSDKPIFKDVYKDFLAFINDSELLIHNADFDIGFLNNEFKLSELKININDHIINITDTLGMARQLHPGQRNSLDVLTDRYNIKGYDRSYHGALLDSKILGEVYLAMTGGQTKLNFNEAIEKKELSLKEEFKNNSVSLKKVIVSSEEEKNHQEYLDKIKIEN